MGGGKEIERLKTNSNEAVENFNPEISARERRKLELYARLLVGACVCMCVCVCVCVWLAVLLPASACFELASFSLFFLTISSLSSPLALPRPLCLSVPELSLYHLASGCGAVGERFTA